MLYNIVLISAIYQHEPAMDILRPLPLEPPFDLSPLPTPVGCYSPSLSSLSHTENSHWPSVLYAVVYMLTFLCGVGSTLFPYSWRAL